MKNFISHLSLLFFVIALGASTVSGAEPLRHEGWSFKEMGSIPVQAGGRVKPFDSYARDLVLQITGGRTFQGWDPVELMLSWLSDPKGWEDKSFILITRKDVKRQLGLNEATSKFSPKELYVESFMSEYANSLSGQGGMSAQATPIARTSKPDPRDEELKRLFDRVVLFRSIVSGDSWIVIPQPTPAPWKALGIAGEANPIRDAFLKIFSAYVATNRSDFDTSVFEAKAAVAAAMKEDWNPSLRRTLSAELFYNRVHPYQVAWIIYLFAALLWAGVIWLSADGVTSIYRSESKTAKRLISFAIPLTFLGFGLHILGMVLRSYIAGRPPVTNMYESIVWVSFGVMVFATALWFIQRNSILFAIATAMSAIGLIISDAAPAMIDPSIHPLVPVLRSNYWLTIHVLTITLSYAALALTLGIGNVTLWLFLKNADGTQEGTKKITLLNLLTYRAMQFGVVLLAAGTILGGVWADYSWGRFWGWDPKEVWALIALLGYVAVIHARFTGWMRPFGFAAWTVVAFTLVVMAWYGVNFVLGVGLHAYGFSTGGQSTVTVFVLGQLAFVLAVALLRRGRRAKAR